MNSFNQKMFHSENGGYGGTGLNAIEELHNYKNALMEATVVAITDQRGRIIYANDDFCRISKYSMDELLGQTHSIINSGYHNREFFKDMWRTIGNGKTWKGEIRNRAKDGSHYWMDTTIVPFMDKNGKPYQYLSIRKEITKRKETERKLVNSETKYQSMFNNSPIPMWIYDMKTLSFLEVNDAAIRQYGYSREEFMQMTIRDIRPIEDVAILESAIERIKNKVSNYSSGIYRHKNKNGDVMHVRIESNIVYVDGKKAEIVLAIDISSELTAQVAISQAHTRLKTAQNIANLGYWSRNFVTGNLHWSDEMYKIYNVSPEQFGLTMDNITQMFHPDDRYMIEIDAAAELNHNEFYDAEHRIITPEGDTKWLSERLRIITDFNDIPTSIEGVTLDITRRKRDEENIKRKKELINATNHFITHLMEHEDWAEAVSESFTVIGKVLNVDRVFYYENYQNQETGEMFCSQKIEWVNDGTAAKMNNPHFQDVPFSIFDKFIDILAAGDMYETIVSELPEGHIRQSLEHQQIKSVLVLPVFLQGKFHGFIGFDDCKQERIWQDDEKAFLQTLTSNLGTAIRNRSAEKALKESNERFKLVMQATREAIVDWDIANDKTTWGDAFQYLFGYDLSIYQNDLWSANIHPDDKDRVLTRLQDTLADKTNNHFYAEFRFIKASGDISYVRHHGIFIRDENGVAIRAIGSMMDVTDSMLRTKKIEQQNEVLKDIAWTQSHVVRAPLSSLMGLIDLFKQKDELGLDENDMLEKITLASNELDKVIHNIVRKSEQLTTQTV